MALAAKMRAHPYQRFISHGCAVCGQETNLVCEGCLVARFCGKECQRRSWTAGHRRLCGPTKLLRAQIKDGKLLDAPFLNRRQKKPFVDSLACTFAAVVEINEPSLKKNGKRRGKQLRCTITDCKHPSAVGVRYVGHEGGKKFSICASCWIPVLKQRVNGDLRLTFSRSFGLHTDEAIAAMYAELERP